MWPCGAHAKKLRALRGGNLRLCILPQPHSKPSFRASALNGVRIVDIGSPRPNAELHSIALDVFDFRRTYNVTLIPQRVPRELNVCADPISNVVDFDDWYTTQNFFASLNRLWDPHTVDRFANSTNTHSQI